MSANVTFPVSPPVWLLALLLPRVQKAKQLTDTLLIGTLYIGVHRVYFGNILNPWLRLWQKWPQTNQAKACGLILVGSDIGWYRHDVLQTSNWNQKLFQVFSLFRLLLQSCNLNVLLLHLTLPKQRTCPENPNLHLLSTTSLCFCPSAKPVHLLLLGSGVGIQRIQYDSDWIPNFESSEVTYTPASHEWHLPGLCKGHGVNGKLR